MALQITEGTQTKSLERLKTLAKTGFPIGYARIESFNLNYNDPSFTAVLAIYSDESARVDDITSCSYYMIGCTLQQNDFDILQGIDDRNLLYKHIEYIINYQYLNSIKNKDNVLELKQELIELKELIGIETLFDISDDITKE